MKKSQAKSEVLRLALRPREAAESLGISERLLWQWTQDGEVPHIRRGGIVWYPVDSLRRWLEEQVMPATSSIAPSMEKSDSNARKAG